MRQYIHNRADLNTHELNATLAVEVPDKTFLERFYLTHSNVTLFKAGISVMSAKDRFEKRVGREQAEKRMDIVKFRFDGITQDGTTHIYQFTTTTMVHDRGVYVVNMELTTVAESERVRLITGEIHVSCKNNLS